jgi:hypothetical protein
MHLKMNKGNYLEEKKNNCSYSLIKASPSGIIANAWKYNKSFYK